MFKIVTLALLVLLSGCSTKKPIPHNKALFPQEDFYILSALSQEERHNYKYAVDMFQLLYEKTQRKEYLYRSFYNQFQLREYNKILLRLKELPHDDPVLMRMGISAMLILKKMEEANKLAKKLAFQTKNIDDQILYAMILIEIQEYKKALLYLEPLYSKNYNEKILAKITIILAEYLHQPQKAIQKLQLHTQVHGCSKLLCKQLAYFYKKNNDTNSLLQIYLKLYAHTKDELIAKKIIQLYYSKQELLHLMTFLENTNENDEILLQLYINLKEYKKASILAQKLYDKNAQTLFLAQSAIFEYESLKDKNNPQKLHNIIAKLQDVIAQERMPLYLNYLGYLLIDHEIDIDKGILYIKNALQEEPDSLFYLDSLAWGYFKKGQCNVAKKVMQKVLKLDDTNNEEVQEHNNAINKCLQN